MSKFIVGTVVVPAPDAGWQQRVQGKRFVVVETPGGRRKNYKCMPCDADGKVVPGTGITAPEYAIVAFSDSSASVTAVEYVPNPQIGAVVKVKPEWQARYKAAADQSFVVFGETDAERVRITEVGGNSRGAYWKAFSRHLVVLDANEVNEALAAL